MGFSKEFLDSQSPEEQERLARLFDNLSPRKKKSPANELTDAICKYVRSCGGAAARVNVMGIYDQKKGSYRPSGSTKGVEDVTCIKPVYVSNIKVGMTVAVEVKIGKDRMSEDQEKRKLAVESAGGVYIVAKTFDQFKTDWDNITVG